MALIEQQSAEVTPVTPVTPVYKAVQLSVMEKKGSQTLEQVELRQVLVEVSLKVGA